MVLPQAGIPQVWWLQGWSGLQSEMVWSFTHTWFSYALASSARYMATSSADMRIDASACILVFISMPPCPRPHDGLRAIWGSREGANPLACAVVSGCLLDSARPDGQLPTACLEHLTVIRAWSETFRYFPAGFFPEGTHSACAVNGLSFWLGGLSRLSCSGFRRVERVFQLPV